MNTHDYDVIIVGAGLAGLTAARKISKLNENAKILVLEANNRVGGRTYTTKLKSADGHEDSWDLGGQWVGNTQHALLDLLKELNFETYPQFTEGKKIGLFGGTKIRLYDDSTPVSGLIHYSIFEAFDILQTFYKIENYVQQIDLNDPFLHPKAKEWDAQTVGQWASQNCYTQTMVDLLEVGLRSVWGIKRERMSMLYTLINSHAAGSMSNLFESTEKAGAQSMKIKGGTQQIAIKLMNQLYLDSVHLNEPVLRIEHWDSDHNVVTVTTSNQVYHTKKVILAIPPCQIGKIEFSPVLPSIKRELFHNFPMGHMIKFIVTYQEAFWKKQGLSGEIVSSGQKIDDNKTRRPILITYDATSSKGNAALVGFFQQEWGDVYDNSDFDEVCAQQKRKTAVIDDLVLFFGREAEDYIDYRDIDWSHEPYVGGCPSGLPSQGFAYQYAHIRRPDRHLHYCGTETAVNWIGYMTGAVESGLRAADEILALLPGDGNETTASETGQKEHSSDAVRPTAPDLFDAKLYFPIKPIIFAGVIAIGLYIIYRKHH